MIWERVRERGLVAPRSRSAMVFLVILLFRTSSSCDQLSNARAERHCAGERVSRSLAAKLQEYFSLRRPLGAAALLEQLLARKG
jgi:hypothetical protein